MVYLKQGVIEDVVSFSFGSLKIVSVRSYEVEAMFKGCNGEVKAMSVI